MKGALLVAALFSLATLTLEAPTRRRRPIVVGITDQVYEFVNEKLLSVPSNVPSDQEVRDEIKKETYKLLDNAVDVLFDWEDRLPPTVLLDLSYESKVRKIVALQGLNRWKKI